MEVDAVRAVSGTTSPSVLIYAGLDGRRRKMALRRRPAEPRRSAAEPVTPPRRALPQ
jgi:hypothetical protein